RSVMTPTTNTRKVSVRLPNSTAALKAVCPVLVGTKLSGVHLGHSEQPNPEEVTRTTAPVTAIPALTTTLPNAQARRDRGDGVQMVRARRSRTITPAAARAICQPQKGTPRTTTSSRSAATGGRVLGAAAAAGETDIRQTVVHGPGLHDATPPLSSPARTCSPHTRIGTSGKAVVRGSTSTVVASSSPCNAADRPGAAGRLCELHLRRRRFVSSTGPALRGCSSPSLRAEVRVEPALAVITHPTASHCHTVSDSPSRTRPTRAAAAGCKLINTPKTRGGIRRRAFSSKV